MIHRTVSDRLYTLCRSVHGTPAGTLSGHLTHLSSLLELQDVEYPLVCMARSRAR